MKDYIQIGIDKGLISLNEDRSRTETTRHIYDLCQRAKTLQEEGKRVLDEAKQGSGEDDIEWENTWNVNEGTEVIHVVKNLI